ncbi:MAG: oxygen-independent coproporphyrinogen III oxidase [Alphaproteobacteria bacterium]
MLINQQDTQRRTSCNALASNLELPIEPEMLRKYAAPVPRYTSYPTAAHFTPEVEHETYGRWLSALPEASRLSLYVHIPFCDTLCWFCGCNTKAIQRYAPVSKYLPVLHTEIANVAERIGSSHSVTHLHWGGGSPDILNAEDIGALAEHLKSLFALKPNAEFAVEIDPRGLREDQVEALARSGVNRVSIGVQDFSEEVQVAINRLQSYEMTKNAVELFRAHGIKSINFDLIYGLPHQTVQRLDRTIAQALSLNPDRVAVFGYAHLPSRMKHQRQIPSEALPGLVDRYHSANLAACRLTEAGYVRVGFDHFAKASDTLVSGKVHRNFQGYTADTADALIGFGPSAIGRPIQGYAQNAVPTADYTRRIQEHGLATARGYALTPDDHIRHAVIERLMCDLVFSKSELHDRFGEAAAPVIEEAETFITSNEDGLIEATADGFYVTERGRMFVRTICAHFDAHDRPAQTQYSSGA